jgi:hypothetical protein
MLDLLGHWFDKSEVAPVQCKPSLDTTALLLCLLFFATIACAYHFKQRCDENKQKLQELKQLRLLTLPHEYA